MLAHLSIRDIVLIDRLDIEFGSGLSVLTGETGAGKSILLDALSLALGARGDAALVREGASQGQVTAVFDVPPIHPVRRLLAENVLDDDGPVILRRVQTADGRTRVFINDQQASVGLMRDVGRMLVELHGQHDERALVDAGAHRGLLDAFGGYESERKTVRSAYADWRAKEKALEVHRANVELAAREADYLRASAGELSKLDPQPGEETELAERRAIMMNAEKIAGDIAEAQNILSGQNAAMPDFAGLLRRLERKAESIPGIFDETIEALDRAVRALDDAQLAADRAAHAAEFDPRELEETEERLFALRAAGRKYSVAVDNLAELRDEMMANLADLDAGEEKLAVLATAAKQSAVIFQKEASRLSEKRKHAADELRQAVEAELPSLKLENASFFAEVASNEETPSADGIDSVEFRVQTNPGTRPGPIMKVASGGELSRILLALKVALADRGSAPTLVFDEIDTGVGGAVADAIGQRLKRLGGQVQVLSVTHAPQVAARAGAHYLISKEPKADKQVVTSVSELADGLRSEEIARMLAGATITEEARAAARRLLSETLSKAS